MTPIQKINPMHPGSYNLWNVSTTCSQKYEKGSYFYVKKLIKWNKAKHNIHHNLSWGWLLYHQAHSFICILLVTGRKWGMEGGVNCQLPPPSLSAVVDLMAWKMAMGVFCIRESI
jgi:hypothetical protein